MDSQIVFLINFSIVFSVFFQFVCSDNFNIHPSLSPRSSGVHYLNLSFGTSPPRALPFVMDTGSSLVYNFGCSDVDSKNNSFPCNSTQCNWFYPYQQCKLESDCPDFRFPFDERFEVNSFSLLSENLTFPETSFENFIVGCSNHYGERPFDHDPMIRGIAGFGRAPYSLPAQMELDGFSYCMLSHDLYDNDTTTSSDLVLITKGGGGGGGGGGSNGEIVPQYTQFVDNPKSFPDYYYVKLHNITVGDVNITVPDKYQVPDNRSGYGGTIVNSGIPYNFMDHRVFNLVAEEFERQVTRKNNNIRIFDDKVEHATGFGLCFNVSSFDDIPKLSLHFDGGAIMDLPLGNYFTLISHIGLPYLVCMMTKTGHGFRGPGSPPGGGPTIVLGNYVQQNFYIHFDLKNNRLGLLNHTCTQI